MSSPSIERATYCALLLDDHSRRTIDIVAEKIGGNVDRFEIAWDIFCNEEPPLPARMAWVMDVVTERHPSLAARYATSLAARLPHLRHPAEQRAATKILARTELPPESIGDLLVVLFDWLENPAMPLAVRANSMQLLYQISQLEPDLKQELCTVIEVQMQTGAPAILARGRMLLKKLRKEIIKIERSSSL
jgi:hypothetical protein